MPTYIAMLKWTPQGLKNVRRSPARLEAAKQGFEALGVKMKDFYLVTGQYDLLAIIEAPDDAALAKAILSTMSEGSVTTETCRAFTEEEYRKSSADWADSTSSRCVFHDLADTSSIVSRSTCAEPQ